MTRKRNVGRATIALLDGTEPVAVTASGELTATDPLDAAWFRRRVLELMYDVGRLKERVADLEGKIRAG